MGFGFLRFTNGIQILPQNTVPPSNKGDVRYNSATDKLELYNGAVDPIVTENDTATLTNKTIDAGTNTVTNITNANIAAGAGIVYSKLNLTNSIVDADINAAAAIAYSKLNLANSIVNADVNAAAAIAYSKLNLTNSIVNADINSAAAIAYSKLNLSASILGSDIAANTITNTNISSSAAIAYSKLNLSNSIVNADINSAAAIAYSKLNLAASVKASDLDSQASANGTVATADGVGGVSYQPVSATPTPWNAQTISYALLTSDDAVGFTTGSSSLTATLPTAVGLSGKRFVIKKVDSGTGTVAIATTSSQTIDNRASGDVVLYVQWDYIVVESDGANWQIIDKIETQIFYQQASDRVLSFSGGENGNYLSVSNNSISLGIGKWRVSGYFIVWSNGTVGTFVRALSGFFAADGTGTTTPPTALAGTVGNTTFAANGAGGATGLGNTSVFIFTPTATVSFNLVNASPQTVHLVPVMNIQQDNGNVSCILWAERIW